MQEPTQQPTPLNVLIVDDNKDAAESLAFCLALAGREIRYATDGVTALAFLDDFKPHIALLDIVMPAPDGHALADELRRRFAGEIVLIAVTGAGHPSDARSSQFAVFDHHLMKPIDFAAFDQLLPRA